MSRLTRLIPVVLILVLPTLASAAELHIYADGSISIIAAELTVKYAQNLFGVNVWGQKWVVPVEPETKMESADGVAITTDDFIVGNLVDVKGKPEGNKSGWIDARLLRDVSLSKNGGVAVPPAAGSAAIATAITPPPAVSRVEPPPAPPPPPPPPPSAPPSAPKRSLTRDLKAGMGGPDVALLQRFLQKNNWGIPDDGPVTGYFGPATASALKKFQAANSLPADGVAGLKTRAIINAFLKESKL